MKETSWGRMPSCAPIANRRKLPLFLLCATSVIALPAQTFTTLHSFDGTDGQSPLAAPVQATNGDFYGTTKWGGTSAFGYGTVFEITPSGTLTTLYSFCPQSGCADGSDPYSGLIQATNGDFYGTTYYGGANGKAGARMARAPTLRSSRPPMGTSTGQRTVLTTTARRSSKSPRVAR
jgi:uncharacterized repeat protein (TIGR03803 family)